MDWIRNIPKIVIREGTVNNISIVKSNNDYTLYADKQKWNFVNVKSSLALRSFYSSYDLAQGDVLLSGFGFGLLPQWIASKPSVTSVTVVEKYTEVIQLFTRHNVCNSKIKILIGDIHDYKDNKHYDWAIFDHYEDYVAPTKTELTELDNNLNFANLWFWSLENKLFNYNDWQLFRNDYSLKIPNLPVEQVLQYMEIVFKRKGFLLA